MAFPLIENKYLNLVKNNIYCKSNFYINTITKFLRLMTLYLAYLNIQIACQIRVNVIKNLQFVF